MSIHKNQTRRTKRFGNTARTSLHSALNDAIAPANLARDEPLGLGCARCCHEYFKARARC
jgi:hypothetical protein